MHFVPSILKELKQIKIRGNIANMQNLNFYIPVWYNRM